MESGNLNKYRDSLLEETYPFDHDGNYANNIFKKGFNAAIALNLPVKFGIFLGQRCEYRNNSYYNFMGINYTTEKLYKYWIENIFKME